VLLAGLLVAGFGKMPVRGEVSASSVAGRPKSPVSASAVGRAAPGTFGATVKPLIDAHCVDCHGADTHKAGLRLDTLAADFRDEKTVKTWTHVFDKIITGEMPPKKRERPPQRDIYAAAQFLYAQLYAVSLEHQQKKGRVIVRRLNGTEYENTLHDLLGTNVPLKEMLPEDSTTAGFDNVSTGLDLSATHFLLYQEAAAKAIQSVVPISPPIPFSNRRTGLEMTKKGPNFQQALTRSCKLEGDALIFYSKLPRYGLCSTTSVQAAGRYRVTMSACSVGGDGKPVPAGFMVVNSSGRESPVLREVREIPHGKPQVIEYEVELGRNQAFVLNLLTTWDIRIFKKPIEEYTGPGLMVEWMQVDGPIDAFPPPSYRNLFADVPLKARSVVKAEMTGTKIPSVVPNRSESVWFNDPLVPASTDPKKDADRLLRAFLPRAFRRPVSEEVQRHFVQQVLAKLEQKYSFFDAMMFGYKLILSSPDFLFLMDSPAASAAANAAGDLPSSKLDDYSLAERLSYFLCSTMPDDELLAVARKGELSKPAVLQSQVERMLSSPRAHRFTENFAGQWLDLRKIDFTIPDPQLYSDFDYLLLWAMPRETQLFFEEVLKNDLSLLSFIDSDWTMLNERLATLYGIPGVVGNDFRKVKLPPDSHRGGVMTQASVLKVTADGTRTSPVLRGKWILERIIGKPPSPPPPDVPAIEPDIRGATTIRQQLDKHRNTPACATCHIHIDPPGFALENFDPIGNWREFYRVTTRTKEHPQALFPTSGRGVYRGLDVEQGGVTPAGKPFKDITDYKKILLEDKDQLARSLTQKLIVYATGADIQFADREVVEQIVAKIRAKNYGFRSLIHEIVQSRVFLNK
jgi:mono/diheme cytochrome c family protein